MAVYYLQKSWNYAKYMYQSLAEIHGVEVQIKVKVWIVYIHLSFTSEHPMLFTAKKEGRIPNPVLLKLKLDVVDIDGVRYTTDVSNKSGVELLTENEAINQIDFEGLRSNDFERKKTASKSEILVPKFIPLNMITGQKYG
jgi:hypothetical protein